jgi:phosphoglycolate phosphatase-like HAD superfamily hydrolase
MTTRARDLPSAGDLRLVVFDCDGVLFDSWRANVAFYNAVLTAAGLPPLDEAGEHLCHRLSSPQLYEALFGDDPALLRRVADVAAGIDYTPFFDLMIPAVDLEASLARLAAHCPLALATNRGRTVAGLVRRFRLDAFFRIRVGILDVARPKPAPDMLLRCLEHTGVAAAHAVYVGDTELDRAAAAEAEMAYIGVGPRSGTERFVHEVREVPGLLLD